MLRETNLTICGFVADPDARGRAPFIRIETLFMSIGAAIGISIVLFSRYQEKKKKKVEKKRSEVRTEKREEVRIR